MTFSAVVRFLIATFEWLKFVAWPWLLCAWRNCKVVAQIARQKFVSLLLPSGFSFQSVLDWFHWVPWCPWEPTGGLFWRIFRFLVSFFLDLLVVSSMIAAFSSFWFWAWTP